jgi:hypothetical protein
MGLFSDWWNQWWAFHPDQLDQNSYLSHLTCCHCYCRPLETPLLFSSPSPCIWPRALWHYTNCLHVRHRQDRRISTWVVLRRCGIWIGRVRVRGWFYWISFSNRYYHTDMRFLCQFHQDLWLYPLTMLLFHCNIWEHLLCHQVCIQLYCYFWWNISKAK